MDATNTGEIRYRQLVVVLGDQLDADSAAFDGFDPRQDAVWMAEAHSESTRVWVSQPRIALFLAAMRHFAAACRARGWRIHYRELADAPPAGSLALLLATDLAMLRPARVVMVEPGEWALREDLRGVIAAAGLLHDERADRHFLCTHAEFARHAEGRRQLRMEFFYREMRRRHAVLLTAEGEPEGGDWNFDSENRKSFGRTGPAGLVPPRRFAPDEITARVLDDVRRVFGSHPGALEDFDWPVTPRDAQAALDDFIEHRLPRFGDHQDAMWRGEPWLFHARLAAAMNLKLLDPRRVIAAAEQAYRDGSAPLAAVEGFIRQILGWREYVRGVYWLHMPDYLDRNTLAAHEPLPAFYWTADTELQCLRESLGQTLRFGYAHHIQRLMVTGLFALLVGVEPKQVHEWYLAVYVDAVEWVELPNTLGMSQFADDGVMASKPYVASGKYIERMSNYCQGCRYDPALATGPDACPFTTLYWDFLLRHENDLSRNQRMGMQLRNLARLDVKRRGEIAAQAQAFRAGLRAAAGGVA
jgi:deoxyribodipyrimidine photolyase-related protein